MRRPVISLLVTLLAAPLAAASLAAQSAAPAITAAPKRPKLEGIAPDTNDAYAYQALGLKVLLRQPEVAADAFWWAARLEPQWADPIYGRRIAALMKNQWLLRAYMSDDDKGNRSPEMRALDSLQLRAVSLNPFLYRNLDLSMFRSYVVHQAQESVRMESGGLETADIGEINSMIDRWLRNAGPEMRAWVLYSQGRFADAAKLYQKALQGAKPEYRGAYHADLARTYFQMADRPNALKQLELATTEQAKRDSTKLVRVYESKAVYEHGVAMLHEMNEATDSAKAAYERALTEDLSYWPAHRALGTLLLSKGDTAGSVNEYRQAVEIKGDDAGLRYQYGWALAMANKYDEALAEFKKAVELNADYAAPYLMLARIYDAAGYTNDAIAQYGAYALRAPKFDRQLAPAKQRLAALQAEAAKPTEVTAPAAKKP